jgi:hypothetical protein
VSWVFEINQNNSSTSIKHAEKSEAEIQTLVISQDHSRHDINQQVRENGKEEQLKDNEHHDLIFVETCQECDRLSHKNNLLLFTQLRLQSVATTRVSTRGCSPIAQLR